mgnify:CR=1 FL=1
MMALQCVRRGESMYITDPKSELYEDLCAYLKEEGYVVKAAESDSAYPFRCMELSRRD